MSAQGPGLLLVSEVYPPAIGGSGVLLHQIYSRVAGVRVKVLTDGADGPAAAGANGMPVHRVSMTAPDWGIRRTAALRRHVRVARAIRRLTPAREVVHCGRALPEGLSALLAGRRYACWTHGEELGFASSSRELTWLMRRVHARASTVFANSAHSRTLLIDRWGVDPRKVVVVHPGVDAARFATVDGLQFRARLGLPPDTVLFLSIGRLQRRKGHDLAIRSLARLRETVPTARYVVAGDGPERQALESLARQVGVGELVRFLGVVDDADLPACYAACDVFLLPNRMDGVDFEGFGIVFLEAAAAGRPVIAGRSGGVPEAVEDGVTGLLVSGNDELELAAAMERLATTPTLRHQLGEAGRRRVLDRFTWERSAGVVRDVVLSGSPS